MNTFGDVIDALGGAAALGRGIRELGGTVRQWRQRDSIPAEYWPRIVAFAKDQGVASVTFEQLVSLAARKKAA